MLVCASKHCKSAFDYQLFLHVVFFQLLLHIYSLLFLLLPHAVYDECRKTKPPVMLNVCHLREK